MKKYWLHIICWFCLGFSAYAQQARQYSFTHYGVSTGLASNEATGSLQDEQGFIWVGTNKGLQRFDGQRYLSFTSKKDDPSSIPNNYIVQLLMDKKKALWLLTGDGKVGRFNTKTFRYEEIPVRVKDKNILFADRVLSIDEEGRLYIIYAHIGLLTWSEKHKEFSTAHNFIQLPPDWQTSWCVQQKGTNKYWIGGGKGLAVFDAQTKQLSYWGHNAAKEAIIDSLGNIAGPTRIMIDSQQRLWFDAWIGHAQLFMFDLKKKETVLKNYDFLNSIDSYHELRGFLEQKDGTIWVKGLNVFARYLEKEKKFQQVYNGFQNEQSIDYDRVNDIFEDRDGNIWVCTNNNGLYSFNPAEQFFTNIRHISRKTRLPGKGSMMSFMLTKQRTLLAGAWGDGLYRFDSNYRMVPLNIRGMDENATPWVWSMALSPDSNTIWMGAQPGIWALNQTTQTITGYNPPIMKNRTVRQLVADRFGNLWMGTQSLGVFKWTAGNGKKKFDDAVKAYDAIPINQVLKMFVCNKGLVWVGTSNFGVYAIDPVTEKIVFHLGTTEPPERRLLGDWAPGITQYDDSTIVVAAKGIHLFNTKRGKITKTIQLPQSSTGNLAAVEKDQNGYLWISQSDGLFRLNPRNEIFIHFDRIDGMMSDHFVPAASYKLPGGRIVFGADNQLVLFDPNRVMLNDPAPDIVITAFKLRNKALLVDSLLKKDQVILGPEDNSITFEFSGMGYGRAYLIKYMLQGLDKDWIIADNNNQAVYSYLPAGNYTFLVKAEDAEGNPSRKVTRLVLKIKPPFWRTWWFFGLAVFATVGLIYWLDKQRTQKIRATESIRTRIATSLTEDMSNSLSSINISSELAKNKIDSDTVRTKEYIGQISDASNRMVQAMYDMVWSINPGNDTLPDTIARMREFASEIENSYDVTVVFDIEQQVMKLKIDMEYRYELLSIYKEAVTNAARHSLAKHIQLSLRLRNNKLVMLVEDDGKGFDLETGVLGRGISEMRRRASAIDASFYIESNVNTGSIVKLEMNV